MSIEPQTLLALSELLGVVMRHDQVTLARVSAIYDRRNDPRKSLMIIPTRRTK